MLSNFIKSHNIGNLYENISLKKKTTYRIGGTAKYFLEVNSIKSLKQIIKHCYETKQKYFIIGNGSNLLISDEYFDCLFISLKKLNKIIKLKNDTYFLESGVNSIPFGKRMVDIGFLDSIHLSLIPGSKK